jgi:hypothetical protein
MATSAKMPELIPNDDEGQQGLSPLLDIDEVFGEPIGAALAAGTPLPANARRPVFPETGLTADQEKYAAGAAGAIAGPAMQRLAEKSFPSRTTREAEGAKRLQEQSRTAQLLRNLEEEELLRRGIDPKSMRPSTPADATSGTKWIRNWAGMDRDIAGGVPEASAAYQRSKGQGKVTGRISQRFGPEALQPGGLSINNPKYTPEARQLAEMQGITRQVDALEARNAAQARLAGATPGPLSRMGKAAMSPLVQGPLAGGFAGLSFYEAYQRWMEGDRSGAVIEALGGIGGLMSMVPGLQIPGLALGAATIPAQYLNDRYKTQRSAGPGSAGSQQAADQVYQGAQ